MNCYAEAVAARFSGPGMHSEGFAVMKDKKPHWTGRVELVEKHLSDPQRWKKPRRIFVNSMSDLFHEALSDVEIARVFGVMAGAPRHTFQILTKRPERMRRWISGCSNADKLGWMTHNGKPPKGYGGNGFIVGADDKWPLPNVCLGVSVEDQPTADERIPPLLETPAAVRFVSYEPALQAVRFCRGCPGCPNDCAWCPTPDGRGLHWVIVGGESGPGARPFDVGWAYATLKACRAAGVACFVKQLGLLPFTVRDGHRIALRPGAFRYERHGGLYFENDGYGDIRDLKGGEWSEWPKDLRVREFPTTSVPA